MTQAFKRIEDSQGNDIGNRVGAVRRKSLLLRHALWNGKTRPTFKRSEIEALKLLVEKLGEQLRI
jgi:hypothetical protein